MLRPEAIPQPPTKPTERPDLASLAWALLRIGAVAFGGLGATLALLERDLVERRGWLRSGDVAAALAFTKPLPGSTGVQVVTFLAWRMGGWPGAILATVARIAPGQPPIRHARKVTTWTPVEPGSGLVNASAAATSPDRSQPRLSTRSRSSSASVAPRPPNATAPIRSSA